MSETEELLESPFRSQSRYGIETARNKIRADFDLGTNTEIEVFKSIYRIEIIPELRFGHENEICSVGTAVPCMLPRTVLLPEICEAAEQKTSA